VLDVKNVDKSYGPIKALRNITITITRGERLVLTGPNGAGKSTLMRILSGVESPDNGTVVYGKNVSAGYFSQDHIEDINKQVSIIEELESVAPTEMVPDLRNLLGAFLFSGDDIYKPLTVLSGGEKSRVLLLKLLLQPTNLLLLDEPTNHLDMVSKDILLDALKNYSATLVFVSHDRYFIQHLATKVLELSQGRARLFYGDYDYYLYRKNLAGDSPGGENSVGNLPDRKKSAGKFSDGEKSITSDKNNNKCEQTGTTKKEINTGKENRHDEKKRKNRLKTLKQDEEEVLLLLDELQKEGKKLEKLLAEEYIYSDGEKVKEVKNKINEKQQERDALFTRWEEIEKEINLLKSNR